MNKKYIDFVPAKSNRGSASRGKRVNATVSVRRTETIYRELPSQREMADVSMETLTLKEEPTFGVIEDLSPKFVNTEVPKRPLSQSGRGAKKGAGVASAQEAKAKKIVGRRTGAVVENPVEKSSSASVKAQGTYGVPKNPFINQAKVAKRPLSKNDYQKKIEATKEGSSGPVAIISKPEKNSKAGLIVAIILTIILGAAAGTVAFLLLPK